MAHYTCVDCGEVGECARAGRLRCDSCKVEDGRRRARERSRALHRGWADRQLVCELCQVVPIERQSRHSRTKLCDSCAAIRRTENKARYRRADLSRNRRQQQQWKRQNRAAIRARSVEYRAENAEKRAAYNAAWNAANPDRVRAWSDRRRAQRNGVDYEDFDPGEVFERDGWVCWLCAESVDPTLQWPHPGSPSLDHVIALSRGGPHSRVNTACSHLFCNLRKHNRLPEEIAMANVSPSTVSKDNPRTLQHTKTGEQTRAMTPRDYASLTATAGYRDITDEPLGADETSQAGQPQPAQPQQPAAAPTQAQPQPAPRQQQAAPRPPAPAAGDS